MLLCLVVAVIEKTKMHFFCQSLYGFSTKLLIEVSFSHLVLETGVPLHVII